MKRIDRSDDDFHAEIEAHLELEIDQLIEEGVDPDEARMLARRRFGNVTRTRERFYEGSRWMWMDHLVRSAGYALRQMKNAPVSTAVILFSLALGVGLNVAIFSIADRVVLRSLPVDDPETLVQLEWDGTFPVTGLGGKGDGHLLPFPLYERLRAEIDSFSEVFARTPSDAHLGHGGRFEPIQTDLVTGSYFEVLGVRPVAGRLLTDDDDRSLGMHPVVVLSHAYWQDRFGGSENILGEAVTLNGTPFTVVGVAAPGFRGTDWSEPPHLWAPIRMIREIAGHGGLDEPRTRFNHVFARLAPDASRESAEAELEPWFENFKREDIRHPSWPSVTEEQLAGFQGARLRVHEGGRGQAILGERLAEPIWILSAATVLVFLLACLNVANLSLARAFAARRATALRTALGAGRIHILRESLVESAVFAAIGSAVGLIAAPTVAGWTVRMIASTGSASGQAPIEPRLDLRVLAFAVLASALVTLVAGLGPALFAARTRPTEALQQRSDGAGAGLRLRRAMVVGQFALALLLLLGAGLFSRTLHSLQLQGPGYDTTNLLTFRVDPRKDGYTLAESKERIERIQETLEQQPEIARAGFSSFPMLTGGGWNNPVTVTRSSDGESGTATFATDRSTAMNAVSPGFFETLQANILMGRDFTDRDRVAEGWNLRSVILNQAFVDWYLDGRSPIGERLAFGNAPDASPTIEVVGVVESFRDFGVRETEPQVFFSILERTVARGDFYVRTTTDSSVGADAVRRAVQSVDPTLTLVSLRTLDDQLDRLLVNERILAQLATAFAVVAALLAILGLYGVLSFSAERRTHEIGIRMALGAPRWSAGGLIVREAMHMASLGVLVAVPLAWVLGRFVESQLYGVRPLELSILFGAALVLFSLGVLAAAVPARRVQRIDPLAALRAD